jgi:hypothetical protein
MGNVDDAEIPPLPQDVFCLVHAENLARVVLEVLQDYPSVITKEKTDKLLAELNFWIAHYASTAFDGKLAQELKRLTSESSPLDCILATAATYLRYTKPGADGQIDVIEIDRLRHHLETSPVERFPEAIADTTQTVYLLVSRCFWPDNCRSPEQRASAVITKLWPLCRELFCISSQRLTHQFPHPLTPAIEGMRIRLNKCSEYGVADVKELANQINQLLAIELTEPDFFSACEEWTNERLSTIESGIQRLMFVGPDPNDYKLESPEQLFVKGVKTTLSTYGREIESTDRKVLEKFKFIAPQGPPKSESKTSPVIVDFQQKTITFRGKQFDIRSMQALRWIHILAQHPGEWFSSKSLGEIDRELFGVRTDQLRKYLPKEILDLIESKSGAGSRLKLPNT